jgi:hypothetical protein
MRPGTLAALTLGISLAAGLAPISAQQAFAPRGVRAGRVTGPITIDGHLTEEGWSRAEVADHFTQRDPDEGKPATERTEIRILYDNDAFLMKLTYWLGR